MRLVFLLLMAISAAAQNALPNLRPPYAPPPKDPFFEHQWHLNNRNEEGVRLGPDLNVRGAWQRTKGEGVIIAIVDDGVELIHHDLVTNQAPALHYDFELNITNGNHRTISDRHGTAVAGLAIAAENNKGVVGVAPAAKFASWNIYPTNFTLGRSFISPEKLARMFAYQSNTVHIQSHSWTETQHGGRFVPQSTVESNAIAGAVTLGRNGKGVVMVRAAGNEHIRFGEYIGRGANDDAFTSDPRAIAVAAARNTGRLTSYSSRGACVLVAAPSGDELYFSQYLNIFTTDRMGSAGYNFISYFPPNELLSDYVYGPLGFDGTSASTPMVAGICALMLSVNPSLTYRDVQQALIHSSRYTDPYDPGLRRNGAGYAVSPRLGFGMVDAAEAVRVAEAWSNRPPLIRRVIPSDLTAPVSIPDAGLRVIVSDLGLPLFTESIIAYPTAAPQPDDATPDLPLADAGPATNVTQNLSGKGALIQLQPEMGSFFPITNAAMAGAAFAILVNDTNIPPYTFVIDPEYTPIPAVLVSQADGEKLRGYIQSRPLLRTQLRTESAVARFSVNESLLCEHVGVRVGTTHPTRAQLRVNLVSPSGTRSVMQAMNFNPNVPLNPALGLSDWTYYSTQHFYEQAAGLWTIEVADEVPGTTGSLTGAELILHGVSVEDLDDDGLDDNWERANFGSLAQQASGDPDGDGSWNAREQVLGTNPNLNQTPFRLSVSLIRSNAVRVAFPSVEGTNYVIRTGTSLNQPLQTIGSTKGDANETEVITDLLDPARFFVIEKR